MNLKNLVNEWFAHLPKGYTTPPYTVDELNILSDILRENYSDFVTGDQIQSIVNKLVEAEVKDVDGDGKDDASPDDRFIADSQEWMESPEKFEAYIFDRYVVSGQSVENIDVFYSKIQNLPDNIRSKVIKILGENTKRTLENGSYKMGQYESVLFDLIRGSIRIPNGHYSELWFAIIHDGVIKGGVAGETGIESDVDVGPDAVSLKNYGSLGGIDFGSISGEGVQALKSIIGLGQLLTGLEVNQSMTRSTINKILDVLDDEEVKSDIQELVVLGKETKIKIIQRITQKLEKYMVGDFDSLIAAFCNEIDELIRSKINTVDWWGIIIGDMVYLADSETMFGVLKSKNDRLSPGVANFRAFKLRINGTKVRDVVIGTEE